jgi:hypothetical protein
MSCEGCVSGPAAKERQRQETRIKAAEYAKEKKEPVILYEDPVLGYQYVLQSQASRLGIIPRERISVD